MPWESWQDHPHWSRVVWVPFLTPPWKLRDIVGNVVLYLPLGWWWMRQGWRPAVSGAVTAALVLSLGTEASQMFSHRRVPSTTDLVTNVCGAWLGARLALRRRAVAADPGRPDGATSQPGS